MCGAKECVRAQLLRPAAPDKVILQIVRKLPAHQHFYYLSRQHRGHFVLEICV